LFWGLIRVEWRAVRVGDVERVSPSLAGLTRACDWLDSPVSPTPATSKRIHSVVVFYRSLPVLLKFDLFLASTGQ
jgi:hypothetical protein